MQSLLDSYSELFLSQCGTCDQVIAIGSFTPAVGRVWVQDEGKHKKPRPFALSQDAIEDGEWQARHLGCMSQL
jgi:hypothetical protein